MAVRSTTGSSRRGPNSVAQSPYRRAFSGNTKKTPLVTASGRTDLNINQDRNDETRNSENFGDGNFPALRPDLEKETHTHHSLFFYSQLWRKLPKKH